MPTGRVVGEDQAKFDAREVMLLRVCDSALPVSVACVVFPIGLSAVTFRLPFSLTCRQGSNMGYQIRSENCVSDGADERT
jgi:hypothetical protein